MTLLTPNQFIRQSEGGIYTITYSNQLDLDFEDIDSIIYIGSTRCFRRRYTQHNKGLDEGHPNWLLKKIGRKAKRNDQELHFHKLLTLPRCNLSSTHYDKILRTVEQWFIHINRPYQDIEVPIKAEDYYRHRLANWSDSLNPTADNAERILPLLTTYSKCLKDDLALSVILKGVIRYWTEITFKGD